MKNYKGLQRRMEESDQSQISLTDPEARSMPIGGGRVTDVGYTILAQGNVQVAVDPKHKLIVDHQVTNAVTERGLLPGLSCQDRQQDGPPCQRGPLGVERLDVLTDMGYYDGQQVKACLEAEIIPYLPKPNTSANTQLGLFGKQDFRHDPENDCYWCPAGEQLTFRYPWPDRQDRQTTERGRERRTYATSACRRCALKPQCTRSAQDRRITRWAYEDLLDEMQARVRTSPEKMRLRKQLVDHPFGTMKRAWNQGYFLTRGLQSVNAEMSLTVLAYNIKRAIKILGVPKMLEALA